MTPLALVLQLVRRLAQLPGQTPGYSPEYWLALPASSAGRTVPAQKDAPVQVAHRSLLLDHRTKAEKEDDGSFARMSRWRALRVG